MIAEYSPSTLRFDFIHDHLLKENPGEPLLLYSVANATGGSYLEVVGHPLWKELEKAYPIDEQPSETRLLIRRLTFPYLEPRASDVPFSDTGAALAKAYLADAKKDWRQSLKHLLPLQWPTVDPKATPEKRDNQLALEGDTIRFALTLLNRSSDQALSALQVLFELEPDAKECDDFWTLI